MCIGVFKGHLGAVLGKDSSATLKSESDTQPKLFTNTSKSHTELTHDND